jgi:hypothetical protein
VRVSSHEHVDGLDILTLKIRSELCDLILESVTRIDQRPLVIIVAFNQYSVALAHVDEVDCEGG